MPRRNYTRSATRGTGRNRAQRGKGRKRLSGYHSGNGCDMDTQWRTHGANLPQTGAQADPTQAAPQIVHGSHTTRGRQITSRWRGEAL